MMNETYTNFIPTKQWNAYVASYVRSLDAMVKASHHPREEALRVLDLLQESQIQPLQYVDLLHATMTSLPKGTTLVPRGTATVSERHRHTALVTCDAHTGDKPSDFMGLVFSKLQTLTLNDIAFCSPPEPQTETVTRPGYFASFRVDLPSVQFLDAELFDLRLRPLTYRYRPLSAIYDTTTGLPIYLDLNGDPLHEGFCGQKYLALVQATPLDYFTKERITNEEETPDERSRSRHHG